MTALSDWKRNVQKIVKTVDMCIQNGEFVVKSFLYQVSVECKCKRISGKDNRLKLI